MRRSPLAFRATSALFVTTLTCLTLFGAGGASAQTIVHDTFTANSQTLTSHVPDTSPAGAVWTSYIGAIPQIVFGSLTSNATGPINGSGHQAAFYPSGVSDGTVAVSFKRNASQTNIGVGVRKTAGGYLLARYVSSTSPPQFDLLTYNGSWTYVASVPAPAIDANWHRIEVVLSGSSITGRLDGVTMFTTTSTMNQTATEHGMFWDIQMDPGGQFDDFDVVGPGPAIWSLSPTLGPSGASVTVSGTGFGSSQGTSTLKFNGVTATPTAWSASSITAPVPATATTGNVVVTVNSVNSGGVPFTVTSNPPSGAAVWDAFTGSDGTSLASHVPDIVPSGSVWTPWEPYTAVLSAGKAALVSTGNGSLQPWMLQTNLADVNVAVDYTSSNGSSMRGGLIIRGTDNNNYLAVIADGPILDFYRKQAGTYTLVAQGGSLPSGAMNHIEVRALGSSIQVYVNGTLAMSVTESFQVTATRHGLAMHGNDVGMRLDNFSVVSNAPFAISSLSPAAAPIGATVTVTGSQFGATQGSSTLKFNGVTATPTTWSATSITAPVPAGTTNGNVVVTVNSVATNGVAFTVTPAPPSGSIIYETFTGTDGVSLASHVPDIAPSGSVWTSWAPSSIASLQGGRGGITSAGTAGHQPWVLQSNLSDVIVAADFISTQASPRAGGLIIRGTDYNNYIALVTDTTIFALYKKVGGTFTLLGQVTPPLNANTTYRYEVRAQGSTIQAYLNGVLQLTVTESFQSTATRHGVFFHSADLAARLDNLSVVPNTTPPPTISSLSPTSGVAGTSVTITGTNFGASQGSSTVTFNGATATPSSWSATSIAVPVPAGATTGNVVVTVNGAASNGSSFTVNPSISSLSPTTGAIGASVTITGNAFGASQGTSTVKFNNITATPTSWGATSIVAPVPAGATTGNVVVTVNSVASNGVPFTVAPGISSLSPTSGPTGTSVTITGTSFGASQGSNTVTFNGVLASPTSWSTTSIVAPVPPIATTGNVVVTVNGVASSGVTFSVAPAISSRSPISGDTGTSVTISGTAFGATQGTSTVTFNGAAATPTSWSATSITVPVPAAATTGNIVVTVGGMASNSSAFTVNPSIASLSPATAQIGAYVTITGTGFGASQGSNTVKFNNVTATPTSWSTTAIVAPVPTSATTGNVVVTVNGTASNGVPFTVATTSSAVVHDTFIASNGTPLTGHAPDKSPAGAFWTYVAGATPIISNNAVASNASGPIGGSGHESVLYPSGVSDGTVAVSFKKSVAATVAGLNVRGNGSSFFIVRYTAVSSPKLELMFYNGAWSTPVSVAAPAIDTNWHRLEARLSGTSILGVLDNVVLFTYASTTNQTATQHGLMWDLERDAGMQFDDFDVTAPGIAPTVSSVSPLSGAAGASVTFTGTNFGSAQGTSTVRFNGITASVSSWSSTSITATVPTLAVTGPAWITVGGFPSGSTTFTVTTATSTVVHDTFSAANGNSLTGHVPDTSPAAAVWTYFAGATPIISNNAVSSNATGPIGGSGHESAFYQSGVSDGTVAVSFKKTVSNTIAGLAVRNNGTSFYIVRYTAATTPKLELMFFNGAWSTPVSVAAPAIDTNWHRLEARMSGSSIIGVLDNSQLFTYTSTTNQTATQHGLMWDLQQDAGVQFDLFDVTVPSVAPSMSSLSPTSGAVTSTVTITGNNFGATQGTNAVRFNGVSAAVSSWSNTSIAATVPTSAITGPVWVTVGGVPSNSITFTAGPGITAMTPSTGAIGSLITIVGGNFGASQGTSTLKFNGTTATSISLWSNNTMVATLPAGATSGPVNVTVGSLVSNSHTFTVVSAATLSSLSPTSGAVGSTVVLTGTNFGTSPGTSAVRFNGTLASINSWSSTSISAIVPFGALTGPVTVTVGGVPSNGINFTIGPWLSSSLPIAGDLGAVVTVSGGNLGASQGSSVIRFNGIPATVSSWSNTSITATVPNGATSGPITVTASSLVSNGVLFTVLPPNSIVVSDTFTDWNGIPLDAHLPDYSLPGTAWEKFNGTPTPTIQTNKVGTGFGIYQSWVVDSGLADAVVSVDFTGTGPRPWGGLLFRGVGEYDYVYVQMDGVPKLIRRNGGGTTELASGTYSIVANQPYRVQARITGSQITVLVNGVLQFTTTHTGLLTSTKHGILWTDLDEGATFDNFEVRTPLGAAPVINGLSSSIGGPGQNITISGSNFGATQQSSVVSFNGVPAGIVSWSATSVVATVPTGATSGFVTVNVNSQVSNGISFTVTTVNDTFSGASGTLSAHVPDAAPSGSMWQVLEGGNASVASGMLGGGGVSGLNSAVIQSNAADAIVAVDVTSNNANNVAGLVLRATNYNNMLLLRYSGTWGNARLELLRKVNGTFSVITGVPIVPFGTGTHRLEARLSGITVTGILDGAPVFTAKVNDNYLSGQHGVFWSLSTDNTTKYDNFAVTAGTFAPPLPVPTTCVSTLNQWVIRVDGGTNTPKVDVTSSHPGCGWLAKLLYGSVNNPWGSGLGFGNGSVDFELNNNPSPTPTQLFASIAGRLVVINQDGEEAPYGTCSNVIQSLSPGDLDYPYEGGTLNINVTASTADNCKWTVSSTQNDWITFTDLGLRTGNQAVTVSVGPNPTVRTRNGFLYIGGAEVPVEQVGDQCSFNADPRSFSNVPASGGSPLVLYITIPPQCGWEAFNLSPGILTLTPDPPNANGPGTVTIQVAANTGATARTLKFEIRKAGFPSIEISVNQCGTLFCLMSGGGEGSTPAADPGGTPEYIHSDALGSVRLMTDAGGAVLRRYDYWPYGQEVGSTWSVDPNSIRFTGQERDVATGSGSSSPLDYFVARHYQAQTGRFTSPDDIRYSSLFDPQSMNLYSYARNNPLRFIDPTGHQCVDGINTGTGRKCADEDWEYTQQWFQETLMRPIRSARNVVKGAVDYISDLRARKCEDIPSQVWSVGVSGTIGGNVIPVILGPFVGAETSLGVDIFTGRVILQAEGRAMVGLGAFIGAGAGVNGGYSQKGPKVGPSAQWDRNLYGEANAAWGEGAGGNAQVGLDSASSASFGNGLKIKGVKGEVGYGIMAAAGTSWSARVASSGLLCH